MRMVSFEIDDDLFTKIEEKVWKENYWTVSDLALWLTEKYAEDLSDE